MSLESCYGNDTQGKFRLWQDNGRIDKRTTSVAQVDVPSHITVCRDEQSLSFYLADDLQWSLTNASTADEFTAIFHLGGENSRPVMVLEGAVYNCAIYSRALTAEEIAHNYEVDRARFNLS